MGNSIEQLRLLAPVFQSHGAARWWVFGSRAKGDQVPESDWDVLVEFVRPPTFEQFMGLKFALEEALGTRVDLMSRTACSRRFLDTISQELVSVA